VSNGDSARPEYAYLYKYCAHSSKNTFPLGKQKTKYFQRLFIEFRLEQAPCRLPLIDIFHFKSALLINIAWFSYFKNFKEIPTNDCVG